MGRLVTVSVTMSLVLAGCSSNSSEPTRNAAVTNLSGTTILEWETKQIPAVVYGASIIFGQGKFVITSASGDIATSADGVAWAGVQQRYPEQGLFPNESGFAVAYGNGHFVAVPLGRSRALYFSEDGIVWREGQTPGDTWNVNYGGRSRPCESGWNSVAYLNGVFHAFIGQRTFTSSDAIQWTEQTSGAYNPKQVCIGSATHGNEMAVATSYVAPPQDPKAWYRLDGNNWQDSSLRDEASDVVFGNGVFVAVGPRLVSTSSDGYAWKDSPGAPAGGRSIAFERGRFVMAGSSGVATSNDGVTWTRQVTGAYNSFSDVAAGAGRIVALVPDVRVLVVSGATPSSAPSDDGEPVVTTIAAGATSTTPATVGIGGTRAPTVPSVVKSLKVKKSTTITLSAGRNAEGLVTVISTSSKTCRVKASTRGYVVTGVKAGKCELKIAITGDSAFSSMAVTRLITVTK